MYNKIDISEKKNPLLTPGSNMKPLSSRSHSATSHSLRWPTTDNTDK